MLASTSLRYSDIKAINYITSIHNANISYTKNRALSKNSLIIAELEEFEN